MFLGQNKISSIKEENGFVVINFEDIKIKDETVKLPEERLSQEQFDFIKSDKEISLSDYAHKRHLFLQEKVLNTLKEHNVTIQEITILCERIPLYIQDDLNHKITKMFGKEDKYTQPKSLAEKLNLWEIYEI